jgi:hypothetical protein
MIVNKKWYIWYKDDKYIAKILGEYSYLDASPFSNVGLEKISTFAKKYGSNNIIVSVHIPIEFDVIAKVPEN